MVESQIPNEEIFNSSEQLEIDKNQDLFQSIKENEIDWNTIFIEQFFDQFTNEEKQKFVEEYNKWIELENGNFLINYLFDNWLPITDNTFNDLKSKFFNDSENEKIIEERENTTEERENTTEERENTTEELQKFKVIILNKYWDLYKNYKNKYFNLEGVELDIKIFENHFEDFLEAAQNIWDKDFVELYEKFDILQKTWTLKLNWFYEKFKTEYNKSKLLLNPNNSHWLTSIERIENSFDRSFSWNLEIDWDKFIYWDQIIDAWKRPPIKYIGDGDFMLESSEVDYRPDREKQKEIRKLSSKIEVNKGEVEKSIERKDDFIWKRKDIQGLDFNNIKALEWLYGVYIKSPEIKVMIEELDDMVTYKNEENSKWESKELLMKKLKWAILIDMDLNIREEVSKIEWLEKDIKKDEERLDTLVKEEEARFGQYKEKLNENDERTRKYIKQYQSLWVWIVWQENLDYLFEQINSNPTFMQSIDLWNWKRINWKIDLSKWEFGQAIWQNPAEIMVRFLNKLYTWDPTEPISIDWFVSWSIEAVWEDLDKFKERVKRSKQNWWYGLWIDFKINSVENLKKPIEEKKEEEK